ncbi:8-oxoguanine DNA glycosylase [Aminipila butyrica]|uniref:DNA-(apurinic or apyrimidinic site) lyase n=1 Tax=Aminipila butyrica TaxID=433296 RepID=A0A858BZ59_9FIRM|nr:DNA glycosylase [Aminipila butyrica]QIB70398.1 8-oxoguanine DNA glycosylase [Aminipila butyrica]
MVVRENIRDFNTDHIFDCGQCFRWEREADGSYTGIAFGRPVNICFEPYEEGGAAGRLTVENVEESEFTSYWQDYLDLNRDYGRIKEALADQDEIMGRAIQSGPGIRILRQEPWETVVSFIISQNNNIPRIKKCIQGLCSQFGQPAGSFRGKDYFSFPTAQTLARLTETDLASIKLGYRAKYIIETARQVAADRAIAVGKTEILTLDRLAEAELEQAYQYLTNLCGVGPKVANCILLFGLGKHESFPIDVWVRRVMSRLYGMEEKDLKAMNAYAASHFGSHGGVAQQYLFYHIRQEENK